MAYRNKGLKRVILLLKNYKTDDASPDSMKPTRFSKYYN
jgi:hypothetical protein